MIVVLLVANVLGWPLIHVSIGSIAVRMPARFFEHDNWLTAPRCFERSGLLYRDLLAIRKWKSYLPDGAPWLGGISKKHMFNRNQSRLAEFVLETRRAELAHWAMLGCTPVFFLWNPPWACFIMLAYAILANLPCILAQRYNRFILQARGVRKRLVTVL